MARDVLIIPHNHFDPTWRRCFDRRAVKHGTTVRSYAEIEEQVFDGWLRLAEQGYTFTEGQTAILRTYLARNPDKWETVRALARSGNFAVVLAGETVQDSNMPTAEGLVRNFLVAMPFYRELCGEDHPALKMAWLEDAFGNNPNYPQVLRGVGAEIACRLSYRACPEPVWVGIDGTKILCDHTIASAGFIGNFDKHAPCAECRGDGCAACNGTGITLFPPVPLEEARGILEQAIASKHETVRVGLGGEEVMPHEGIPALLETLRQEHPDCNIRFATVVEAYEAYKASLEEALAAQDDTPTIDLNPAMPGCYVTRIRNKQRTRAISYKLLAAEAILASDAWQRGIPGALPTEFARAWQLVTFNHFHDALTGTLIDSGAQELHDMLDVAEAIADCYLPAPAPVPQEQFMPVDGTTQVTWGRFQLTFDRTGLHTVLTDGDDLFGELRYTRQRRPFRIGELVLEADFGDAWGQRIEPLGGPREDGSRIPLGDYQTQVEMAGQAIRWRGVYTGGDPLVNELRWVVTLRPSADGTRLDFTTEVEWDTRSRRLRVYVPVAAQEATATYEVPFGFIDRTFDPAKLNYSQWASDTREFPTLHWAGKALDARRGVAVLNQGLPCYRWLPGSFDLSLLRSPEWYFCVNEPHQYEFWDMDGQRDSGRHHFNYAILPYTNGLGAGDLTRAGYAYNRPLPLAVPFTVEGDVVVTAWKPAEDGAGWILRVQEAGGAGTQVRLVFDRPHTVTVTDLLERPQAAPVTAQAYTSPLHKHGILTLRIN